MENIITSFTKQTASVLSLSKSNRSKISKLFILCLSVVIVVAGSIPASAFYLDQDINIRFTNGSSTSTYFLISYDDDNKLPKLLELHNAYFSDIISYFTYQKTITIADSRYEYLYFAVRTSRQPNISNTSWSALFSLSIDHTEVDDDTGDSVTYYKLGGSSNNYVNIVLSSRLIDGSYYTVFYWNNSYSQYVHDYDPSSWSGISSVISFSPDEDFTVDSDIISTINSNQQNITVDGNTASQLNVNSSTGKINSGYEDGDSIDREPESTTDSGGDSGGDSGTIIIDLSNIEYYLSKIIENQTEEYSLLSEQYSDFSEIASIIRSGHLLDGQNNYYNAISSAAGEINSKAEAVKNDIINAGSNISRPQYNDSSQMSEVNSALDENNSDAEDKLSRLDSQLPSLISAASPGIRLYSYIRDSIPSPLWFAVCWVVVMIFLIKIIGR